jgi:hypothetical protein
MKILTANGNQFKEYNLTRNTTDSRCTVFNRVGFHIINTPSEAFRVYLCNTRRHFCLKDSLLPLNRRGQAEPT